MDFSDPGIQSAEFVVAYLNGWPIGCGAMRLIGPVLSELKRVFVEPDFRGQGVASSIVGFLEERAKSRGADFIRLECGEKQPEALALYEKLGYCRIDRFGEYVNDDSSVCMEKRLHRREPD
jgi:ribosomal protein S18 acetylase RimI-like enzyme